MAEFNIPYEQSYEQYFKNVVEQPILKQRSRSLQQLYSQLARSGTLRSGIGSYPLLELEKSTQETLGREASKLAREQAIANIQRIEREKTREYDWKKFEAQKDYARKQAEIQREFQRQLLERQYEMQKEILAEQNKMAILGSLGKFAGTAGLFALTGGFSGVKDLLGGFGGGGGISMGNPMLDLFSTGYDPASYLLRNRYQNLFNF